MFDPDKFSERAAIMEFTGGMSRYQAETEAARAQGVPRWKALQEVANANIIGNPEPRRDHRQTDDRNSAGNVPGVQPDTAG